MRRNRFYTFFIILIFSVASLVLDIQAQPSKATDEQEILKIFHSISSHTLLDYVKELT